MEKIAARLGAVLYVCWGLLHFTAAYGVFNLAQNSPATMAQGRLMQTAFYLAVFATAAIIFAITLNWRNDRFGFWVNAVMVGVADIPFILFVLIPGYAPWWPGLLGPILWIAAFLFTTVARIASAPSLTVGSGRVGHRALLGIGSVRPEDVRDSPTKIRLHFAVHLTPEYSNVPIRLFAEFFHEKVDENPDLGGQVPG
jgi:hypothetical protein